MSERRIIATGGGVWRSPSANEPGVSAERLIPIEGGILGGMNRHFDKHTERMAQVGLTQQVQLRAMWSTPDVRGYSNEGSMSMLPKKCSSREEFVGMCYRAGATKKEQMWPTPNASDNRDRGNMSDPAVQRRIKIGKQLGLSTVVKNGPATGTLNPTWVEWLMGFPIGFSASRDWVTPKSRSRRQSPSTSSTLPEWLK